MNWSDYLNPYSQTLKPTTPRHKTFVSFCHEDDYYRNQFEKSFSEDRQEFVSMSVSDGDIDDRLPHDRIRQIIRDDYIRDATVTIVLIGKNTWKRRHVDWEIGSSIRHTSNNPRNGLLGILLPTYLSNMNGINYSDIKYSEGGASYNPKTIPPRLFDNVAAGYAKIYSWPNSYSAIREWIHNAFSRRNSVIPNNSYPSFARNRDANQTHWEY